MSLSALDEANIFLDAMVGKRNPLVNKLTYEEQNRLVELYESLHRKATARYYDDINENWDLIVAAGKSRARAVSIIRRELN